MDIKGSLPHWKEPTIVQYPEPQKCISHLHIKICKIRFNIIVMRCGGHPTTDNIA